MCPIPQLSRQSGFSKTEWYGEGAIMMSETGFRWTSETTHFFVDSINDSRL